MKKTTVFLWSIAIWSLALALGFGFAPEALGTDNPTYVIHSQTAPTERAVEAVLTTGLGTPVQFVELDPATRSVTVFDESGQKRVHRVDPRSLVALATAQPGQLVFLSYRYDRQARVEAVIRLGSQ